jgi:HD-GYP domain-containing protein (c-di-GMP phosphodiesterase class II)
MRKTIQVKDLRIGMYVVLPGGWFKHPFLKSEFVIRSKDQIDKIIDQGIREILIDLSKQEQEPSSFAPEPQKIPEGSIPIPVPPKTWSPKTLIPGELLEAIHDKKLPPKIKSKLVYESSKVLVERLFEDPKAENIKEAKKGISEIVDLIISDDGTSQELLKITDYDYDTYTHSVNVGVFSLMLAKSIFKGSPSHNMDELGAGFFLHDIGKVRIDQAIINKPGKLTDEEMRTMKTHPYQGYTILKEANELTEESRIIVMQHHEREDGSGYPRRLRENSIHTYSRICCIADVYEALTAKRPYKQPIKTFDALKLMKNEMLNHFHQELFEKFVLLFSF